MPARRAAHAAFALAALSSLACATAAERRASLDRAPANAPAGLLAEGYWSGTLNYVPPNRPRTMQVEQRLTVEVHPVRDSASLVFVLEGTENRAGSRQRLRPREVAFVDDRLTFRIPARLMGFERGEVLSCELVLGPSGLWDGGCLDGVGFRAATFTLGVPPARALARQRAL